MSDIVAFLNARLDETQADAEAAQAVDPGPWTVEVEKDWRGEDANTNWRPGHGAATVVAADTNPLWEPSSYTSDAGEQCMTVPTAQHIARHDPARVLREVAAKRAVVELHTLITKVGFDSDDEPVVAGGYCGFCQVSDGFPDGDWPCDTLKLLVAPDADHPDYDPTWSIST